MTRVSRRDEDLGMGLVFTPTLSAQNTDKGGAPAGVSCLPPYAALRAS